MAKLTQQELRKRLAFDYDVAMDMRCPVMNLSAHHTATQARKGENAILDPTWAHLARHYRVGYRIKTLIGPDRYHDWTLIHFDLLANGNYPYSRPACWVLSEPMPWSPHFMKGEPICIGGSWSAAQGTMLFGQLLAHIARLLNFDEVREKSDTGWNREAAQFWEKKLKLQPITPNLVYPRLPVEKTHGVQPSPPRKGGFRQLGVELNQAGYQPTAPRQTPPHATSGFRLTGQ
jgi:hypothetical protein